MVNNYINIIYRFVDLINVKGGVGMSDINFVEEYLNWLKSNMTEEKLDNGIIEITSPFLDKNNDYTQIYVERTDGNKIIISDYGYVINELAMVGVDINSEKRKEIITTILNRFGVKLIDDTLFIECSMENFPQAKHSLLQAMLAVDDLFYLSRPNIVSLFTEEVESFFKTNNIYYISNVSFMGKAGYLHNYEFALQRSKTNPERLIKVANKLNKMMTESILFAWNDTRAMRDEDAVLFTFINDKNNIQEKYINALESYDVIPIKWSERNKYLDKLA